MAGIYLHIPFCKRRCAYCDFFSTTHHELINEYVTALCHELEMRKSYLEDASIDTIYFGGGTPSLLNYRELEKLFIYIYKVYKVNPQAEITLEANPDDLTTDYINQLKNLPINRISIGIQTFNDERLRFLHRRHTSQQAINAIKQCQDTDFSNISIDLIYGLPDSTLEDWNKDLQQALSLNPPHLSAYHLTYEKGTPIWKLREEKHLQEVKEEISDQMYDLLTKRMTDKGYIHYEISNFCLPDMHSRHNSNYWREVPYLGCGASAHSYNLFSRQWNIASLIDYIKGIQAGKPMFEREELNIYTRYNDRIVTSLRTLWGIPLDELKKNYGEELFDYCIKTATPYLNKEILSITGNTLRFTEKGLFLSDGVMSDLLWIE